MVSREVALSGWATASSEGTTGQCPCPNSLTGCGQDSSLLAVGWTLPSFTGQSSVQLLLPVERAREGKRTEAGVVSGDTPSFLPHSGVGSKSLTRSAHTLDKGVAQRGMTRAGGRALRG